MEQRLTGGIAGGLLWIGGGRASQAVLRLLVLVVLARLLPPADFGVVNAAMVVIGFSLIFSQLGLGPAIIQRSELEPGHIDTAFVTSVALGVTLGGLVWWSAPAAGRVFPQVEGLTPVLRALAWVFPLAGLGVVADSLMQRELRFRFLATTDVVTFAIGYGVVGVTLAILEFGVWALVAAQLVQTALHTAIFLAARPPRLHLAPSRRALGELVYLGGGFTASKVANYAALQGDNLVVGRWLGAEALGLYGRAYEFMAAPVYLIGEALEQVLFPTLARVQGDTPRLALVFRRGVGLIALTMLPATAILFAVAPEFIDVVLGPQWAGVVAPFQILALGMFLRTSHRMSDALARATGAVYRRAWRQTVYAALVILGAWIGQHWGIAGVAAGVVAALTANFLLMAQLSLRLGGLGWASFWEAHRPALRLTAAVGVVAWTLTEVLRRGGAAPALLLALVLAGVLGCILLLAWARPRVFLGPDGLWLLDAVRDWTGRRPRVPERAVVAPAPAVLVRALSDALDLAKVRCCQWQSHANSAWAQGDGDIDLLVDRAHSGRVTSVLGDLGFKEALQRPDRQVPDVRTFYGLDPLTHRLIHLHIHHLIVFGRGPTYRLPLETPLLDSAVRNGGGTVFRAPARELEFILLVLRLVERYSLREALRPGSPRWLATMLDEAQHLAQRIDPVRAVAAVQEHLPWIDAAFWAACQEALRPNLARRRRLALHRQLRRRLRPYALSQDAATALAGPGGGGRPAWKRPASGGMVVALVGGDGAGKSTCAAALDAWLGSSFETLHAHLGLPPRSLLTLAVGAALKPGRLLEDALTAGKGSLGLVRFLQLLRHLCTARDRYRLARTVHRFAAQGGVAICERYPVTGMPIHAGPRIAELVHTVRWQRVATLLRDREADYYRRIPPADLLVVLRVAAETAVQRKTTEPPDYVRSRAHALARMDWTGSDARIVDANRPLPQVVGELKEIVWSRWLQASAARSLVVELVGPAGVGKSTLVRALRERDPAICAAPRLWAVPLPTLIQRAAVLLPTAVALPAPGGPFSWFELKLLVRFDALYHVVRRAVARGFPIVLLDEGPVFALSCIRVHCERSPGSSRFAVLWRRALAQWTQILDAVVVLDAPDALLVERIRTRERPHTVKHKAPDDIYTFLARYRAAITEALATVGVANGTRRIDCSTAAEAPDHMAGRILSELAAEPSLC